MAADPDRSTRPPHSPQPPGTPRWTAMFYDPLSASWHCAAESPDRTPVVYAIGEMTQTRRAKGGEVTVALWGPGGGGWQRFDLTAANAVAPLAPEPAAPPTAGESAPPGHARHAERLEDRRHQVLVAGLNKAGLHDLGADDEAAVRTLVDRVDETTLRRVAHWMALAGRPVE
ncbi:hypothetical protein [Streptomyces sp. NPDC021608]|uniref:hypothetical protein n=1 Tax=Streptomyces sp. NPDC021608 TaxID=3154903 RepID=UPI0033D7F833